MIWTFNDFQTYLMATGNNSQKIDSYRDLFLNFKYQFLEPEILILDLGYREVIFLDIKG